MTSDHQVIHGHLKKIECKKCGLVRNGFQPNVEKIKNEYKTNNDQIKFCINPNYYFVILKRLRFSSKKIFLPLKN